MLSHRARSSIQPGKMLNTRTQVRNFWPFNKRADWSSHLDPQFARFHRQRHINTRAKLLKSVRRRNQWDIGLDTGLFFTPKHIRQASHYYGRGNRSRWLRETEQQDGKVENDRYELSEKEKLWKAQMERMRQRIERDPYEAVFGKRVEPFWESIMPNWMREELGLTSKDDHKASDKIGKANTTDKIDKTDKTNKPNTTKPESYAYTSQTSWDSWTNKVRKSEWDSNSGAKHYEYDPISNRMVQIGQMATEPVESATKSNIEAEHKATNGSLSANQHPKTASETPARDIDGLTASSIRASMGKPKSQDHHQIAALLQESAPKNSASSHFDHAETYYMLEQELQSLQAQRDNLAQNASRVGTFGELGRRFQKLEGEILLLTKRLEAMNNEQIEMAANASRAPLATALSPARTSKSTGEPLRSAVDRMQSKATLPALDLDDSAAHESTESTTIVPKAWNRQAELLQADRVKRTAGKPPYPFPPAWATHVDGVTPSPAKQVAPQAEHQQAALKAEVDHMVTAMSNHETSRAAHKLAETAENYLPLIIPDTVGNAGKANNDKIAELEAAQEKYKAKIAALKNELNLAYKQSSRHADEFRDQIRKAEQRTEISKNLEAKYKAKIAAMKEDLDTAFKQSSVQADEFRDHIKKAEAQLDARIKADEHMQKIEGERQANIEAAKRLQCAEQQLKHTSNLLAQQLQMQKPSEKPQAMPVTTAPAAVPGRGRGWHEKSIGRLEAADVVSTFPPRQPAFNEIKHAYRFKPDDLEDELKGAMSEKNVYRFKKDNMEAELGSKTKQAAATSSKAPSKAANALDLANGVMHEQRPVNPIDGTTAATGNYASPTGFVNFDPVVPFKTEMPVINANKTRVRRQEHVFSGTKNTYDTDGYRKWHQAHFRLRRRIRFRARIRRLASYLILMIGVLSVGAYISGQKLEQEKIRLQASQEVYRKMAEQYEKKGEPGLVQAMQENTPKSSGGYFWK